MAHRAVGLAAGKAVEHQGDARVLEVDRHAGEAVRGGDGGEVDAQRRDLQALSRLDQVEADDLGLAGQRDEAEALAPSGVLGPGGAVAFS